jgi:hypothetical protein
MNEGNTHSSQPLWNTCLFTRGLGRAKGQYIWLVPTYHFLYYGVSYFSYSSLKKVCIWMNRPSSVTKGPREKGWSKERGSLHKRQRIQQKRSSKEVVVVQKLTGAEQICRICSKKPTFASLVLHASICDAALFHPVVVSSFPTKIQANSSNSLQTSHRCYKHHFHLDLVHRGTHSALGLVQVQDVTCTERVDPRTNTY